MAGTKGRSGGARRGSGPTVRRLRLSKEAALELRILTLNRRGVTGNNEIQPVDIVTEMIHASWLEYDAMIQRLADDAVESGVQP